MHNSQFTIRNILLGLCIVHCALCIAACSIPVLEAPQCTDASLAVKQLYSYHFGNDMTPSAENLKARQKYLTGDLYESLAAKQSGKMDYFTKSDEYPKTFKIGKCDLKDPDHVDLQVQLYWVQERGSKIDTTQREVQVDAVKQGDHWLIDSVSPLQ